MNENVSTSTSVNLNDLSGKQSIKNVVQEEPSSFISPLNNTNIPIKVQYRPQSELRTNSESTQPVIDGQLTQFQSIDEIGEYQCWSIFNILCCCWCLGCIACYYSNKTNRLKQQHNAQGALNASKQARCCNIFSTILGILMIILYVIYFISIKHS